MIIPTRLPTRRQPRRRRRRRCEDEIRLHLPQQLRRGHLALRIIDLTHGRHVDAEPLLHHLLVETHQPEDARLVAGRPGDIGHAGDMPPGKGDGGLFHDQVAVHHRAEIGRAGIGGHHRRRIEPAQRGDGVPAFPAHPRARREGDAFPFRLRLRTGGVVEAAARMRAGAGEQAPRPGRSDQRIDAGPARRTAHDRHLVRIAAEAGDIAPHPVQPGNLVHQPVIAGCNPRLFGAQAGMGKETEPPQPVIERHHHDSALVICAGGIVEPLRARPHEECAAMDQHQHRQPALDGWRGDIDRQAILALPDAPFLRRLRLRTDRPELRCVQRRGPGRDRPGRGPAMRPSGRRGEGNALEPAAGTPRDPAHRPGLRHHHQPRRSRRDQPPANQRKPREQPGRLHPVSPKYIP
ncbi:hypothetical protein BV95_04312 [Sphingobium chlorophenolicum]|uniref:Uncharacterized protein n=1 Tax=Sphingobium chlorophenolicum TaxID=46429 RepID=A0A081R8B4_SPHCR|nr:hypothetical protein BV95_04312 [Sphingobium chlorophenolicum]